MKHELSPKHRFILRIGVLGYGSIMFVVFDALHILRLHQRGASLAGLPVWLALNAILWPLVGYAFGAYAWRRMSRRATREGAPPSRS